MVNRLIFALPCIIASINLVQAKIKGVSPEKQNLYKPNSLQQWTCLDGSLTIPYNNINDDYCDCPDGSDEPGTSACPNSYFYCENKGHLPAYIKSWAVNDGVCDEACCDGSDESNGLTNCPNRCKEVSKEYQKVQNEIRKLTEEGYAAKKKLMEEAKKIVQEWELEKTRYEDELVMKRGELKRYQQLEKEQSNQHKTTTKKSAKRHAKVDNARQTALENKITSLKEDIELLLSILHDLKRDHNHNFHDMAVKTAISGYDEFLAEYEYLKNNDDLSQLENDVEFDDESAEEFANEEEEEEEEDEEVHEPQESIAKKILDTIESTLPAGWKDKIHKYISTEKENGKDIELEAARKNRDELESIIRDTENKLNDVNDKLNRDYGKDYEWLKLKDTCVEKDDGE
ncbi:glucosidase II beta subunit-like-domain-containing protein [Cunninghamella echinulata]|nr:glucosidase II beta subunit-like-domain-containing protein [Cunninghamella echinulata]